MPIFTGPLITAETLPSLVLIGGWVYVLRIARRSIWQIAGLSLVGTIGHELLHAVVGWLVHAKPTSFSIFPKKQGNTWVLGSVGFANVNIWNAAPLAFAPLLLAGIGWLSYNYWTLPAFLSQQRWSWLSSGYLVATCLTSCVPSVTDLRIGLASGLFYFFIGYLLWASG